MGRDPVVQIGSIETGKLVGGRVVVRDRTVTAVDEASAIAARLR